MYRTTRKSKPTKLDKLVYDRNLRYESIVMHRVNPLIWKQSGGGYLNVEGTPFEYKEDVSGLTFQITSKLPGRHECFILKMESTSEGILYAVLVSVTGVVDCAPGYAVTTTQMVRAVVNLASSRGSQWIMLSDESAICNRSSFSLSLADYYLLSYGQTWYESILPFQPVDPDGRIADAKEYAQYNSWDAVVQGLKRVSPKKMREIVKEVNTKGINTDAPGSAMLVLRRIPKSRRCDFFGDYIGYILNASNILSLRGTVWYLPLNGPYIPNAKVAHLFNISVEKLNA